MINVLVINSDTDGVGYWRTLMPHITMNDQFDDIHCEIRSMNDHTLPLLDENYLKQFQVLSYNKMLPIGDSRDQNGKVVRTRQDNLNSFYTILKKLGIKLVYDIDDYWILNSTHLNYKQWKENNSGLEIEDALRNADAVTTTTPIFAEKIKPFNPNVYVMENGVNMKEQQWALPKIPSEKLRFLWGGGISHISDLRKLKDDFKKFDKEFQEKCQLYLCGYDLRIKLPDGKIAKDDPRKSQWGHFEDIFTNGWTYLKNSKYKDFLMQGDGTDYGYREEFKDEFYQRRWTKEILLYGTMYREADVSIAPLMVGINNSHLFNLVKSQLKLIEAGAHHMPLICTNYGPYTIDDIDGKKTGIQKGFLIDDDKQNWYEKMKWYQQNPNAVKEHGEANYEYIKSKFEIHVVNRKRYDLYNSLSK